MTPWSPCCVFCVRASVITSLSLGVSGQNPSFFVRARPPTIFAVGAIGLDALGGWLGVGLGYESGTGRGGGLHSFSFGVLLLLVLPGL